MKARQAVKNYRYVEEVLGALITCADEISHHHVQYLKKVEDATMIERSIKAAAENIRLLKNHFGIE